MDHISLKWNNHNSSLINSLDHFKAVDSFVDVTLVCEGHSVKAHKIILSSGSNVLHRLLLANPAKHPIIILTETKYDTLRIIIDFLYKGKIDIQKSDLKKVLQVATTFEINELKNLCEKIQKEANTDSESNTRSHPKSSELNDSSSRKKRQRRLSSDSDIVCDAILIKQEIRDSPCSIEEPEVFAVTETLSLGAQTEIAEFDPQIADTRSLEVSSPAGSDVALSPSIQKKDASTECDIQPLKERRRNSEPAEPEKVKLRPILPRPEITGIFHCTGYRTNSASCEQGKTSKNRSETDESVLHAAVVVNSESDLQNRNKSLTKRKRSIVWKYFMAVNSNYAVCKICRSKLSYKTTVTNLTKHLKKKHQRFDPKNPPKLPELPLSSFQIEDLEIFEEVDFNSIEEEPDEEAVDDDIPSTSTPCILKIT